jgi:hypothetical protein
MLKKLLIAGGIVAVLIAGAVAFLASNLDSIVEKAIETLGPEMTGVAVNVKKVSIALTDGRGEIAGLVVGNPKGYKAPHAFRLGSIVLALDAATVTKDVIVVRELTIEAPDMVYEKGAGGSNVEVIQRHVDDYVKSHFGGAGGAKNKPTKGDAAPATRFIVEKLQIRNGKVHLAGIAGKDAEIPLPLVSLHDMGKSRGGATGGEIASVVVKQMTDAAIASAVRALAQEGAKRATESLKGRLLGR